VKTALTIAGSDPTGGAGLQADLGVFRALGVHGLAVPAALTAQSTVGVEAVEPVGLEFLRAQLQSLLGDIRPDAVKTGMLYTVYAVELVAEAVKRHKLENLVIDPVTVSSSGAALVVDGALDALRALLFPLARVVTPNIYEASVLTGMTVEGPDEMESAARALREMGPEAVLVTGGHLEDIAMDVYWDGGDCHRLESRKAGGDYHGTGCALSAAVAANMALGHAPLEAVRRAKEFVNQAIRRAHHPGRGMGLLGF
jgi:hydroxymethylpyrimidine/phosphomethylpyrimidine kinase